MQSVICFVRLWNRFCLRQLLKHSGRAAAVILGVALGAAVFTSVRLAVDASLDSFGKSVEALSGKAERTVIGTGSRIPESVVASLLAFPFVKAASPIMTAYVWPNLIGSRPLLLVGIDPILDRPLRGQPGTTPGFNPSHWVDLIAEPGTLMLAPRAARDLKVEPGDTIELQYMGKTSRFSISATLDDILARVEGGDVALTDISTFQEFTSSIGYVDQVDLLFQPGTSPAEINSLAASLPAGTTMELPSESAESGRGMISAYRLNMSVLSFVSLFVGMFLVYSLVSLHATSRREEIAILRSIGAPAGTICLLHLAEGAFFGLIGWLVAVPLGALLVRALLSRVSATISMLFVRVSVERLELSPQEILLSFSITLLVCLIASVQPAIQAMRVPPAESLLIHSPPTSFDRSTVKLFMAGLLLVAVAMPVSSIHVSSAVPVWGYASTFLLFLGFTLCTPWILKLAGTFLPYPLWRLGGIPAFLAARYLRDSGTRTAVSVGALLTAMALFVSVSIMIHSFRRTVTAWVDQSITGDLFIRPKLAEINHYRDPLPPAVVAELKSMPRPAEVLPYRRLFLRRGAVPYQFEPIDFDVFTRNATFMVIEGFQQGTMESLALGNGVVISEVFSVRTGLRTGSRFVESIEGAEFDLPILGVFRDYRTQGGVVHFSLPRFITMTGDTSWSGARIYLGKDNPGKIHEAEQLRSNLLRVGQDQAQTIEVTLGGDLRSAIIRIFDETFAVTTVLLLIAIAIAALGITSTLAVLVLERKRELHTMLSVGADATQLRSMILWESVLLVCVGTISGLCCGFMLSRILIFVINRESFGWTFIFSVDWQALLISVPLIFCSAVAAALPAVQIVFSTSSAEALRER